ncbi:unnamed protein product [Parascedosporium putredinis]|uniref:Rab-GAP TBC domain-containing protein n=1 Tax=Parascedosporium putredinis TaxID=1442378 RepID=A0A9P1GXQ1_9PEZI|nr:unnamed protein product [Parascedosporium putredinis]CAI7989419.1 unnamed protein product [Parascedosporium putredinis]
MPSGALAYDARQLRRQRSMRHREFGLYASPIPDHAQPMPLLISSWATPDAVSEFQADLPAIASLIMQGRDQEEAQETTAGSDIVSDGSRTTTPTTSTSILSTSYCDGGPVKTSPPAALLPPAIITSCTSSIKKRGARPRSRSFTDNWIRRKDVSSDNNIANQRDGPRISPREAEATASTAGHARNIAINGWSRKENHDVGELWANSPWNAASPQPGIGLEDAGSKSIMRHGRAREWRGDDPGSREIVCTTQVESSATTSKSPTLDDPGNGGVSPPRPPVLAPAPQRAQFAAWAKFSGSLDERQLSALADKHSSLDLAVSRAAEKVLSSARQSGQDAAASRYHQQQQQQQQEEKEAASAGWKEGASGGAGGAPFGLSTTNPPAWCFSHGGRTVARDPSGTPSICTTPPAQAAVQLHPIDPDFHHPDPELFVLVLCIVSQQAALASSLQVPIANSTTARTSTFEGPNHPSHDSPKHTRNNNSLSNPTPLFRPTPTYGRTLDSNNTSIVTNFTREPIPWLGDGEPRASVRSQRTLSTTHAASFAERSSRVTKGSSITSMYANLDDEPSVEDVMVLYEQGFNDDTEPELDPTDNGHAAGANDVFPSVADTRPDTTMSTYSLRAAAAPAVVANPVQSPLSPNYPPSLNSPTSQPDDDALPIFEARPVPASELDISEDFPAPMAPRAPAGLSLKESVQAFPQPVSAPPVEEDPESRDRYGFKKVNQYITREQYDEWNGEYSQYLARRRTKWVQYMKESGLGTDNPLRFPIAGVKTKRFIRKGIPQNGVLVKQKAKDLDADIIERDLHRTFPDNIRFRPPGTSTVTGETPDPNNPDDTEPAMISSLRRVLHAFSIYNPKIGYCQSLNFIAGLLLLFVPTEEQCFWLLNVITRTFLPGTHETNLHGSKVDLGVLMTVLHDSMPDLWSKLAGDDGLDPFGNLARPGTGKSVKKPRVRRGQHVVANSDRLAPITVSMAPWFMSCFIGNLPIETTLRVWDVFFYEGSKTMFRIALAILKVGEDEIKGVEDPMEMFSVVQTMPRRMLDANQLMSTCFKRRNGFGHLSQSTVDSERREMRERDEIEQRRIAALDGTAVATTESPGIEEKKRGLFGRRRRRYTDAGVPI